VYSNDLGNPKDKIDMMEKSEVYQVDCVACDSMYIDQTKRKLKTRFAEHHSSIRLNHPRPDKSNIARHVLSRMNNQGHV
jgi:Zn ribbon nucleic-acid-binding protein